MADNTTGLPVQTITGQFVSTKLVDSGGSNVAAVSATGALSSNLAAIGGTAPSATNPLFVELSTGAGAYTLFGQAVGTAPYHRITDGTLTATVRDTGTSDSLNVAIVDGSGNQITSFGGGTQYVGDAGATATPTGTMAMALANATAPADVSANADAVAIWALRNGSQVVNLASGGTLITNLGQAAANAMYMRITDATNSAAVRATVNALNVDVTSTGGTAVAATNPIPTRLTDGSAFYTRTGQTGATAAYATLHDGTTAVAVIAATTALKTDLSSVAGTATVTAGVNGLQAIGGPVAPDSPIGASNPVLIGARASTATPTAQSTDGDVTHLWASLNGALNVTLRDTSGNYVGAGGGTQYIGDAGATSTPTGTMSMALANATAPADVSANADAVALWALRNGSLVVNLAVGGTLLTNMGQAAASANFVRVTDGTNTAGVIAGTTALKTDLSSIAGTAPSATSAIPARLTDGTSYYAKTGQTAATAAYAQLSDQTNTVGVIAATSALKTDIASIAGTAPGATAPLPVRLTDGASFYNAGSGAPTDPKYSTQTSAALGAGASATVTHYVTSGKTGQLVGVDAGSTVPCKVVINTVLTGTPTARVVLFTQPFVVYQWRAPYKTFITRASADATSGFSVTFTNKDAAVAADVYSTAYWDEVP